MIEASMGIIPIGVSYLALIVALIVLLPSCGRHK